MPRADFTGPADCKADDRTYPPVIRRCNPPPDPRYHDQVTKTTATARDDHNSEAPAQRPWEDPFTLLCERCGYVIEGLDAASVCPECAKPIVESLPDRRPGTPWQRQRGVAPMVKTWFATARSPASVLAIMAVKPPRIRLLLCLAALPIAWAIASGLLLLAERERPLPSGGTVSWSPGSIVGSMMLTVAGGLVLTPLVAILLGALTWIEARGLVLISAQRGFRVHPELAHTITRHGAPAWLVCGLGAALVLPLLWRLQLDWRLAWGEPPAWLAFLAAAGVIIAIAGFLGFEFFAWLGLRRCRFANRSRQ